MKVIDMFVERDEAIIIGAVALSALCVAFEVPIPHPI
jgi:hypothetical protein